MKELKRRIMRTIEIGKMVGWFDKWTWKTLFPPFSGWDVGCSYCVLEEEALKSGVCLRYKKIGVDSKCGVFEKGQQNEHT